MDFDKIEFEIFVNDRPLKEEGRELLITEIMGHQKYLRKATSRVSTIQLAQLTDKQLTTMLGDAFTLFALRFFDECGRNPATALKDI